MGLVAFGHRRIGFWMADRTSPPEVPHGLVPHVEGTPVEGGATLVLVAADQAGVPVWSLLLHAPEGASLLLPWGDRLVVALGSTALFLDDEGVVHGRYRAQDDWISGWPTSAGLLLLGRKGAHLVGPDGTPLWQRSIEAEGLHFMQADDDTLTLAVMGADDWREARLDLHTGADS
jgi:hypothetical protein